MGTLRLLDPISLGPSTSNTADAVTLETFVSSSSEANSLVSIKPMESMRIIVDPLDEIMKNFNFKKSSDQSLLDVRLEEISDSIRNYSEEDFTNCYGSVSYSSKDEWVSGLELYDDEPTIFSSEPNHIITIIIGYTHTQRNIKRSRR
jgi:hypothetical protein